MDNSISNDDAIELAYAFAIYRGVRYMDVETRMDCWQAESAARRLRRTQEEVGIYLEDTDRLLAAERRMTLWAKILKD